MKIGILLTGLLPPDLAAKTGEYDALFQRLLAGRGFTFETWRVVENQFPEGPEAAEGWLITGSKHGVYEDHSWMPPLEALVRAIYADGRPMVGVCFGHQLIAQALGGRVEKFSGGWAVGATDYAFADGPRRLHAWHQDQVLTPPAGAEVVASNAFCRNAALIYGDRAYSVQAHPEFDDAFLSELIEKRGPGVVPDDRLDAARGSLGAALDRTRLAEQFARFFHGEAIFRGEEACA